MTISDKPEDIYAVAGRCPIAASVLSDPKGDRFHVLFLGKEKEEADREVTESIAAGLTRQAGVLGLNREGQFESVAKPGFSSAISRASVVFLLALIQEHNRQNTEVAELERIAGLMDPRAQA
jgi:hypothetical protein